MKLSTVLKVCVLPLYCGLLLPRAAFAADEPIDPAVSHEVVDEVVVTARRRTELAIDVPGAITVMGGAALKESNVTNIQQVALFTPSLHIAPANGSDANATIAMRGMVQNATIITLDPAVALYLGDVYLGRANGAMMNLLDVDHVEVLKGPQGTLYGQNSTGGAVKIVPKRANPNAPTNGYVDISYGSYNEVVVEGAVGAPLVADKLGLRVAGAYRYRDGYSTLNLVNGSLGPVVGQLKQNDKDEFQSQASLLWTPSSRFSLELAGDYFESHNNSRLSKVISLQGPWGDKVTALNATGRPLSAVQSSTDFYTTSSDARPYQDAIVLGVSATAAYDLTSDISAKIIAAFRRFDTQFLWDSDATNFAGNSNDVLQEVNQRTVEIQLSGLAFDGDLDWIGGIFYFGESGRELVTSYQAGRINCLCGRANSERVSTYAQGSYKLNEQLSLSLGARYSFEVKRALIGASLDGACSIGPTTPGLVLTPGGEFPCQVKRSTNFPSLSWSASIDYDIKDNLMIYARAGSTNRSGGQNLRGTNAVTMQPFDQETATDVEIGAKGSFFDRRLSFSSALYHTFYKDFQYTATVIIGGLNYTPILNASGNSNVDGAELEVLLRPTDKLTFNGSVGYTDVSLAQPANAPAGVEPQLVPKWTYAIGAAYRAPTPLGKLTLKADYAWRDKMAFDNSRLFAELGNYQRPYGLLSANATLEIRKNMSVSVFATNILDKEYCERSIKPTLAGVPTVWQGCMVGEPRMVGASARYTF